MQAPHLNNPGFNNVQPNSFSRARPYTILTGIVLTLLTLVLTFKFPLYVERINNAVLDFQIGILPLKTPSPMPVLVQVDDLSLAKYGQWPWPRYQLARLMTEIKDYGAAAVGIDALFIEPDRTSPLEIQRAIERDFNQSLPINGLENELWDYDLIFGKVLKSGPFVVSYLFNFDNTTNQATPCQPKAATGAWLSADNNINLQKLHHPNEITCNVSPIQQGANANGFINSAPDKDGIFRKTPLVMVFKDKIYPSLALQTYLSANAIDSFLLSPSDSGLTLKAGKLDIPLDSNGNLLLKLPTTHNQSVKKYSVADVLSGKLPENALKNRIVFVGFSAAGLHEVRPTPYSPEFLGVELHAAVVDNLVRQDFLQRPDYARPVELIVTCIVGLGLFIGLANTRLVASLAIPGMLMILLLGSTQWLLANYGIVMSPALPVLMVLLALLSLALFKYISEYTHAKHMTLQVALTQEGIIDSFCSMSEYRDPETGAHIKRTQAYIKALATHLKSHPQFNKTLTNEFIELLFKAAPLHDIGKIGIRDYILLKNDNLTDAEFDIMKSHPKIGADIIDSVASQIGWNPFMQIAYQICLCHQEKWDGSGYPEGLQGEVIPLPARFMAIADVYDALISKRVYKPAFSHNKALGIIKQGKNTHFDPRLVDAFEAIHGQFRDIALKFLDSEEQKQSLLAEENDPTHR